MLHQLQDARKRGVPIVTFNPLRERGLVSFANPQSPIEMLTAEETHDQYPVSSGQGRRRHRRDHRHLQMPDRSGRRRSRNGRGAVLDVEFIDQHTHGFDEFAGLCARSDWADIERESGLPRAALEAAAAALRQGQAA